MESKGSYRIVTDRDRAGTVDIFKHAVVIHLGRTRISRSDIRHSARIISRLVQIPGALLVDPSQTKRIDVPNRIPTHICIDSWP